MVDNGQNAENDLNNLTHTQYPMLPQTTKLGVELTKSHLHA